MQLAREDRPENLKALQELRNQRADLSLALEAAKLIALYSDGAPGAHNVPAVEEPDAEEMDTAPPEFSAEVEAILEETARRGGDAGSPGDGSGGGA